jgi:hypothetical protein
MAATYTRLLCGTTLLAAALLGFGVARAGQGPGQPPKRIAPTLDTVLPLLNASLVRVRPVASEAALTGLRITDDQALVWVPGTGPVPKTYETGVFDTWSPATVRSTEGRFVLLRTTGHREAARRLDPTMLAEPAFVVAAAGAGKTLDVQTVWVDPREPITLAAGAAVFTMDGELAGVVTESGGQKAILTGMEVLARAGLMSAKASLQAPR